MRKTLARLRSTRGFTLAETLVALLILTVLGMLVVFGVNTAVNVHRDEDFVAQSEVLASTIDTALSDPVRLVKKSSGGTYTLTYNGVKVRQPQLVIRENSNGEGQLYIQSAEDAAVSVKLLNEGAYGNCKITQLMKVNDSGALEEVEALYLGPAPSNPDPNPTARVYKGAVFGRFQVKSTIDSTLQKEFDYYFVPLISLPSVAGGTSEAEVTEKSILDANISTTPSEKTYTGSALEFDSITVTYHGVTLTQGTDYTVLYSNNVNAGTATATIAGTGEYTGYTTAQFTINPAQISAASISEIADMEYTGSALTPQPTLVFNGRTLVQGTDYTLTYANNTNAGTATITIRGQGNFTGTATTTFQIISNGPHDGDVVTPYEWGLVTNSGAWGWEGVRTENHWQAATDVNGVSYLITRYDYSQEHNVMTLVYYNGKYYKAQFRPGIFIGDWVDASFSLDDVAFDVSHLTDGQTHRYRTQNWNLSYNYRWTVTPQE